MYSHSDLAFLYRCISKPTDDAMPNLASNFKESQFCYTGNVKGRAQETAYVDLIDNKLT